MLYQLSYRPYWYKSTVPAQGSMTRLGWMGD